MINSKSCFILGLPSAGKTSYLAALAFSMQQNDVPTMLRWDHFSGNQKYLVKLAETWSSGSSVPRTNRATEQAVLPLHLADCDANQYNVTFPDLSGETFQAQYNDREIAPDYAELIRESDGILVFINPDKVREPTLISELPTEARHAPTEPQTLPQRIPSRDDSTAVQMVTFLQDILALVETVPVSLAIVISAWDVIKDEYRVPLTYVKKYLPLLWQYLTTNSDLFSVQYYGVSAQGGSLDQKDVAERLIEKYEETPTNRILVVNEAGELSHDITLPLWSVMNAQSEEKA